MNDSTLRARVATIHMLPTAAKERVAQTPRSGRYPKIVSRIIYKRIEVERREKQYVQTLRRIDQEQAYYNTLEMVLNATHRKLEELHDSLEVDPRWQTCG